MDPGHRDRIAFMRICSGEYQKGMKLLHVRSGKEMKIPDAITFMAADRQHAETAYAGDIIGLHNHGTINIGDSFSQGEELRFTGIPNFAPEIFQTRGAERSAAPQGAAKRAGAVVRGGRYAVVQADAQQ